MLDPRLLGPLELARERFSLPVGVISSGCRSGIEATMNMAGYPVDFTFANDFWWDGDRTAGFRFNLTDNKRELLDLVLAEHGVDPRRRDVHRRRPAGRGMLRPGGLAGGELLRVASAPLAVRPGVRRRSRPRHRPSSRNISSRRAGAGRSNGRDVRPRRMRGQGAFVLQLARLVVLCSCGHERTHTSRQGLSRRADSSGAGGDALHALVQPGLGRGGRRDLLLPADEDGRRAVAAGALADREPLRGHGHAADGRPADRR